MERSEHGEAMPQQPVEDALVFSRVAVRLGGRRLLRDVGFSVNSGEVVGLIGCNGVGKTTLLRCAVGTQALEQGEISLSGEPLAQLSRREVAQRVAVVAQDLHVPFPFRVAELVLMGRAPYQGLLAFESQQDHAVVAGVLEEVGISELKDRRIDQLSGGERQLVLFARALAQKPQWLLLDEPTAFLDLRHRLKVLGVVREFARQGGGALVVSHDLTLAARVCDRLVVLSEGEVIAVGKAEEVLDEVVLERAFGVRTRVFEAPDRALVVVPRLSDPPR